MEPKEEKFQKTAPPRPTVGENKKDVMMRDDKIQISILIDLEDWMDQQITSSQGNCIAMECCRSCVELKLTQDRSCIKTSIGGGDNLVRDLIIAGHRLPTAAENGSRIVGTGM